MDEQYFHDALRLSDAQTNELLDSLDLSSSIEDEQSGQNRRQGCDIRLPYRKRSIQLTVEHPAGGVSRFFVTGRNLTPRGFCALHGGYLHAGAACRLTLPLEVGGASTIHSKVLWCTHVRDHIHEVGFRFDQVIDLWRYVEGAEAAVGATSRIDPNELQGDLLIVSDLALMCEAYQQDLKETRLKIRTFSASDEAIDSIGQQPPDLIIFDFDLDSSDTLGLLERIRQTPYFGPLLLATGEPSTHRLAPARQAGASGILRKPFRPVQLYAVLLEWLTTSTHDSSWHDASSEYDDQPDRKPLLQRFVQLAGELASDLASAMERDDLASARTRCRQLYETAGVFGYAGLSQVARIAMTELDASNSIEESKLQMQRLLQLCDMAAATSAEPS